MLHHTFGGFNMCGVVGKTMGSTLTPQLSLLLPFELCLLHVEKVPCICLIHEYFLTELEDLTELEVPL